MGLYHPAVQGGPKSWRQASPAKQADFIFERVLPSCGRDRGPNASSQRSAGLWVLVLEKSGSICAHACPARAGDYCGVPGD